MVSRNLNKIFFALTAAIVLLATFRLLSSPPKEAPEGPQPEGPSPPRRALLKFFHLDLKGGPPRLSFLREVLPLVRRSGANALLLEYEDMFPFSGALRNLSAGNAYSPEGVRALVGLAEALRMEVVPLVQTFGHLEFALKLEEFRGLREVEEFPGEVCPLRRGSLDLVKEMIKQIMTAHPNSKYVHVGCDEVRHVGLCPRCSRVNPKKLFASHVIKVADYVRRNYPGVTPLIWDDMLRRWTYVELAESGLGTAVEPVVWAYGSNIFTLVPPSVWNMYRRTFPRLWVASAFKGAFGESALLPDLGRHLENTLSWRSVIAGEEKVSGVVLTGWSRYDHFAVLCELLPAGLPSLLLGLAFLHPHWGATPLEGLSRWLHLLRCPPTFRPSDAEERRFFREALGECSFPGSDLYSGVVRFEGLRGRVRGVGGRVRSGGWTSGYHVRRNFSSPWRVGEMFGREEGLAGEVLGEEVSRWKASFLEVMGEYFDEHTRGEWEEQNIRPVEEELEEIRKDVGRLLGRKTWPRRPLR